MNEQQREPAAAPAGNWGVKATWWYTYGGVVFFVAIVALLWAAMTVAAGTPTMPGQLIAVAAGALWVLSTAWLAWAYPGGWPAPRMRLVTGLAAALLCGAAFGAVAGSALLACAPLVTALAVLPWGPGVRRNVTLTATLVLAVLALVDSTWLHSDYAESSVRWMLPVYTALLPIMIVTTLWWWDVVARLDAARIEAAELAATRERLRLANDVHDLQGHHLQVIALQLELAERLLSKGKTLDAAAQVSAARSSVDAARQGTRDLAARFRGVPLRDELSNAADLLRAAGLQVRMEVSEDADAAPREVFGPIIRESTTNVLKHHAGASASLSFGLEGGAWRLRVSNASSGGADESRGAGLRSMAERAQAAGGEASWAETDGEFVMTVLVPKEVAA